MSTKTVHMDELHFDHQLWATKLNFYKDEIKIYQKRLEQISQKNTAIEIKIKVEQFQNRFIIQLKELNDLLDEQKNHEKELALIAQENTVASDHIRFNAHTEHEEEIVTFEKLFSELKVEFSKFCRQSL
ncbi:MAG: hypothetical protein EAZ07_02440 [Cytophagales bacterium]|nr:MAG: hypothetical protein EAZ07_02440 [Cytophagales bacterium]